MKKVCLFVFMFSLIMSVIPKNNTSEAAGSWCKDILSHPALPYCWDIVFDFDEGNPHGTLNIWHLEDSVKLPTAQETIYCQRIGKIALMNGEAIFSGDGYFKCRVPSLARLHRTHPYLDPISPGSISYDAVKLIADITFVRNSTSPLIALYHPSKSHLMSLDVDVDGISALLSTRLQGKVVSTTLLDTRTDQSLIYQHQFNKNAGTTFNLFSYHINDSLESVGETQQQVTLTTASMWLFIGGAPNSQGFFQGRIDKLIIDPNYGIGAK